MKSSLVITYTMWSLAVVNIRHIVRYIGATIFLMQR